MDAILTGFHRRQLDHERLWLNSSARSNALWDMRGRRRHCSRSSNMQDKITADNGGYGSWDIVYDTDILMLLTLSDLRFCETIDDAPKRWGTPPSKQLEMPIVYGRQGMIDKGWHSRKKIQCISLDKNEPEMPSSKAICWRRFSRAKIPKCIQPSQDVRPLARRIKRGATTSLSSVMTDRFNQFQDYKMNGSCSHHSHTASAWREPL